MPSATEIKYVYLHTEQVSITNNVCILILDSLNCGGKVKETKEELGRRNKA
jgi:hypothetical protein